MTDRETNERLDRIARALGAARLGGDAVNHVHACRPDHPLNRDNAYCFRNLAFTIAGRRIPRLCYGDRDWINAQADAERELVA